MSARRLTREEARLRTRRAILDAARAQFTDRGYRGASLDDIAEAAGYSKGAVYSNWSGKEALFLDLLDEAQVEQPSGIDISAGSWALATLEFFVEAVRSPESRAALADRYRQARHDVGSGLGQGRADPAWATWEELASVAMALGSGLIIQNAIDDDAIDGSLADRVMRHLLEGASPD